MPEAHRKIENVYMLGEFPVHTEGVDKEKNIVRGKAGPLDIAITPEKEVLLYWKAAKRSGGEVICAARYSDEWIGLYVKEKGAQKFTPIAQFIMKEGEPYYSLVDSRLAERLKKVGVDAEKPQLNAKDGYVDIDGVKELIRIASEGARKGREDDSFFLHELFLEDPLLKHLPEIIKYESELRKAGSYVDGAERLKKHPKVAALKEPEFDKWDSMAHALFSSRAFDMPSQKVSAESFEDHLRGSITRMEEAEITVVVDAPGGRKAQVSGRNALDHPVGVIVADKVVVQLDSEAEGSTARLFLESSLYSKIEGIYAKGEALPAGIMCKRVSEEPKLLGEEFSYVAPIFKALFEMNIFVLELNAKSSREFQKTIQVLMKQHCIASEFLDRGKKSEEATLRGIREYATAKEIEDAFARYYIKKPKQS